ncbi:putative neutral zinc metallopeptidase [Posidoniimonas polymericola]|uniref:Putative neutral zinc metallopeptidase n=1 Tax=Posidoniimonas polymericola TaxID=2528002 RepID=A0A5C5ZFR9_9BACT|nr:zinc metallopeptidase [Posidoniimonas polymericola]TWT85877.1 putative neutral zinc metallopeptidase [Posidoniimonas polymericola]
MWFFDPMYFLFLAPAMLLAFWAQMRVKSTYAAASQHPASLTGAAAARHMLDSAGLQSVAIEPIRGKLTDHYDPSARVLRLSEGVYGQRNLAAVGIAAHEAGHALQHAKNYAPLTIRNLAVPAASFGSGIGMWSIMGGAILTSQGAQSFGPMLISFGIAAFSAVVFFQLVNLPVEFDASNRAKAQLVEYGIVSEHDMGPVRKVLNAAGWTYVAATLQSVLTLLYLLMRFGGSSNE